jgi:peptidoglycan/LPS O-acetylase OafA/YrhL
MLLEPGEYAHRRNDEFLQQAFVMHRPTSLYLDIVRPIAALFVLLSHVSLISGGELSFLSGAGVQAVDVFFVLSGFVIAHVCTTRERDAGVYFVSRAARIYSVAIPALILTAALDYVGVRESPATYGGPFQAIAPGLIIRCILFINEQWNTHRFPGSNGPYWSLGFEVWYYVAFGAFIFTPRPWRWLVTAAVLVFIGPKVALLFPLWLMGVALYHICASPLTVKPLVGWFLFAPPLVILAIYQLLPHPQMQPFSNVSLNLNRLWTVGQDYLVGFLFCMHLVGFTIVSPHFARWLGKRSRSIRWIAGATFSIYLIHLPIMHFLVAISSSPETSSWMVARLIIITTIACFAFAEAFERRKNTCRRLIVGGLRLFDIPLLRLRRP